MESTLNYSNISYFHPEKALDSLTITNIPENTEISPQDISKISSHLTNGAELKFEFINDLNEQQFKKFSLNLKFAGLLSITLSTKNTIISKIKSWSSNKNKWKNINPKTSEEQKGVTVDNLIDPFDPNQKFKTPDCLTKPKPCKNCTCGRAEIEKRGQKIDLKTFKGCGRCHLGDGMRCEFCPFRGLPAFKQGEKISIPEEYANNTQGTVQEEEKTNVKIKDNKVTIDI